ncbi:MAG: alpha/beta hydrolase, partial [Bifidobacteriaceae bacterium]|nr:alpha/beta hydrolase [Bifidobacteriaceae bacterium]
MDIQLVDPALRKLVRRASSIDFSHAPARRLARLVGGLQLPRREQGVSVTQVRSGPARLRLYRPAAVTARAGLLWIHGGGYLFGRARQDDFLCARVARELGIPVASAEYRLAPENPFPAGLDDVQAAWDWLAAKAAPDGRPTATAGAAVRLGVG